MHAEEFQQVWKTFRFCRKATQCFFLRDGPHFKKLALSQNKCVVYHVAGNLKINLKYTKLDSKAVCAVFVTVSIV